MNTTVATFSLFGTLLWLPRWYRPDGALTTEQVIEAIIDIASGGPVNGRHAESVSVSLRRASQHAS